MRTWIFQGNPDGFDLDAYLVTRPAKFLWLVTRHADEIGVRGPGLHLANPRET